MLIPFQLVSRPARLPVLMIQTEIAFVDESYPPECIKFRSMLNPTHARFRVNGTPSLDGKDQSPSRASAELSADSLPLKPPRKPEGHPPTPSHTSGSQSDCAPAPAPQAHESLEITEGVSGNSSSRERDALDDIIDEAKAAKDLVRLLYMVCETC